MRKSLIGGVKMKNENKFDGKAIIYSKFRPDYPEQLIIDLIKESKLNVNSSIADIGAGTGIMTKKFLDQGFNVYAVEPNEEMRMAAKEYLKDYKGFILINGSAENTTLDNQTIDLIVVTQAFHWFNMKNFREESQRILKPHGKVAIISNERITEDTINKEIAETYYKYCPNFKGFSNGLMGSTEIYDNFFLGSYTLKTYDNPLIYNKSTFIGRHMSSSFSLTEDDPMYPMLVESLSNLFDKHSKEGYLILPNITKCWCGIINR